jgi:NAD(P)-dependent dehydrogenase (short-subunit alcohol dehydrogenase family)
MSDYRGRRVVVTGCASGIGEALARALAERGAEVVGLDRQPSSAPVAEFHHIDLAQTESVHAAANAIEGPIDALFNVAGVSGTVGAKIIVGINFVGTRELTEALLPRMESGSAIVITSSLAASRYLEREGFVRELLATQTREQALAWCDAHPAEVGTGYAISKDALMWYTLTNAVELAARGIRINAVGPGITATPIIADTIASRGEAFLNAIPMPLGRVADPREQATVIAFLGSSNASYLSGQLLWVDGGYTAGVAAGQLENVTGGVGAMARRPAQARTAVSSPDGGR